MALAARGFMKSAPHPSARCGRTSPGMARIAPAEQSEITGLIQAVRRVRNCAQSGSSGVSRDPFPPTPRGLFGTVLSPGALICRRLRLSRQVELCLAARRLIKPGSMSGGRFAAHSHLSKCMAFLAKRPPHRGGMLRLGWLDQGRQSRAGARARTPLLFWAESSQRTEQQL